MSSRTHSVPATSPTRPYAEPQKVFRGREETTGTVNGLRSAREVLAGMPLARAVAARLDDPAWPSPAEVANARHALAQGRTGRQDELNLWGKP